MVRHLVRHAQKSKLPAIIRTKFKTQTLPATKSYHKPLHYIAL